MDECLVNQSIEQIFVHVGTQYFFEAEILQSSIKVTDWIGKIMDDDDDFNDSINQTNNLEQDDADFDQIPVRLYFDLGERTITLAELKSIAPGYVFELGRELRRAVTIRVGGKKIGEGELVEIDGSIGVAVLAINSPLR
jgi:type III secretion protein Q